MKIRLSVIISGYNTPEAWWKRCVKSVLLAIGSEDEVIVVDDGSRDLLRVDPNWWTDERVHVLRKENGGLSSARNVGLELVQGKYVTFVDSDDEVVPEIFERCVNNLEKTDCDVCLYGVKTIWPAERLQKVDVCVEHVYGKLTAGDAYELSRQCLLNYACNKVYRMDFLAAKKLIFDPEGMPCEDIIFNLNCAMAGARWCAVADVGYIYYRTHGTLLSSYKKTGFVGLRHGAEAWQRFRRCCGDGENERVQKWLERRCGLTDESLLRMEWDNIWTPRSPYSLMDRWRWIKCHAELGGLTEFVRKAVYTCLRRYCYFSPIRVWHLKRLYPHARRVA